tara:strand:+ start:508 stop:987 length:480 start_codon:yes stop_codon:yes gene_type:complete
VNLKTITVFTILLVSPIVLIQGQDQKTEAKERPPLSLGSNVKKLSPPPLVFKQESRVNPFIITFLYLVLIIGAGATFYFVYQKRNLGGLGGTEKQLKVNETLILGNKQFLVVAEYKTKKILIGVGNGFITHLTTLENESDKASFDEKLKESMEGIEKKS